MTAQAIRSLGLWSLGLLLGLVAGWVTVMRMGSLLWAAVGFFLAALVMGFLQRDQAWRWAIAVGIGLPVSGAAQIVMEMARDPASHNLWPFEMTIVLVFYAVLSIPVTLLAVYIGATLAEKIAAGRQRTRSGSGPMPP